MRTSSQQRNVYFGIAALVIPLGLLARGLRGDSDTATFLGFVATYLPDTLWAVLFFFVFAGWFVRWRAWALAGLTLFVTVGIELSQLYRGEPLAALRGFGPTRFLLGNQFLWSDVACLVAGTFVAVGMHRLLNRK